MSVRSAGVDALRGRDVLVAGLGASGRSAVEVLIELGARVTAVDGRDPQDVLPSGIDLPASAAVITDPDPAALAEAAWRHPPSLVVTSPGWSPTAPLLAAAAARDVPVWSEVELAWQICPTPVRWLTLTGTNGKTTTVSMLAEMLNAHGWRAPAVGNVGTPIAATVLGARGGDGPPLDALAVELSSFQLHYTHSVSAIAAACLNLAADHLDWHGSMEAYAAAKARIYERTRHACVYNKADPRTRAMVAEADVLEGARAVGFTLGSPGVGEVGIVEDVLVDRAFVANRHTHAAELASVADLRHLAGDDEVAPHLVANALAAAALARAAGVEPAEVGAGLRAYSPGEHRMQTIATIDGVRYVNDSKATNAHAAAAALSAMEAGRTVWIVGGLAKGARLDELVQAHRDKLRAAVVIGVDQRPALEALERHAPGLPRHVVPGDDTEVMRTAVAAARTFAQAGDVVLLAPACASMDQFRSYAARGEAFATAVRDHDS